MRIEVWFDEVWNSWVIMKTDDEGNQLEEASYRYTKKEALEEAQLNKDVEIHVFKRNGELQKILNSLV